MVMKKADSQTGWEKGMTKKLDITKTAIAMDRMGIAVKEMNAEMACLENGVL